MKFFTYLRKNIKAKQIAKILDMRKNTGIIVVYTTMYIQLNSAASDCFWRVQTQPFVTNKVLA